MMDMVAQRAETVCFTLIVACVMAMLCHIISVLQKIDEKVETQAMILDLMAKLLSSRRGI